MLNCFKEIEKVIYKENANNLEQVFEFNKNFIFDHFNRQNKLVITKKISSGRFSKVYSSQFNLKKCAVKVIKLPDDIQSEFLNKNEKINLIKTELIAIKNLKHPNIIEFYFYLIESNKLYFVMELAEKGDLVSVLNKNHGPIKENICCIWLKQLVNALIYIHEKGFAHRDIKADNILITKNNIAKLCDFGFCKRLIEKDDNLNKILLCSTQCGTPQYSAPEILLGKEYDAQKSDIWSLGIVLFIMLNNSIPFYLKEKKGKNFYGKQKENTLWHLFNQQQTKNFEFINQKITLEARNLVSDMLEPNVSKRITLKQILKSNWFLNSDYSNEELNDNNPKIIIENKDNFKGDILLKNDNLKNVIFNDKRGNFLNTRNESDIFKNKIENDIFKNKIKNLIFRNKFKKDKSDNNKDIEDYFNDNFTEQNLQISFIDKNFQNINFNENLKKDKFNEVEFENSKKLYSEEDSFEEVCSEKDSFEESN